MRTEPRDTPPPESLLAARVRGADGTSLPLGALASPERACRPAQLLRWDQRNGVHLTARLSGVSLGAAAHEVERRLQTLALPVGYSLEVGGLYAQEQEALRSLAEVLLGAALAVLLVLLFQLRSLGLSLAVLAAAPVALAGGALSLWATRTPLNLSSMMGAVLLVGLLVKNGILLLERASADPGSPAPGDAGALALGAEALLAASRARLRPICMTTAATLAGLLPLVIGIGAGSELHRPLAIAVVGGLLFSTAATLYLVPALALLLARRG